MKRAAGASRAGGGDGLSVRLAEPLARHTAWRTGGVCDAWVVAHDLSAVATVVADCRSAGWRLTQIGCGTRAIFRDGAVPGVVMRLGTAFSQLVDEGASADGLASWQVGASYPVAALVAAAAAAGRRGLEGMACAAGSLGASLLYDEGWSEIVREVTVLRRGKTAEIPLAEARAKQPVVLGARLSLAADDPQRVAARTREAWRKGRPAPCSSWYEPPRRGSLRALLGAVRLPMVRLRQVAIPQSAPELIVNLGDGTAADLQLLHKSAIDRVLKVRGEELRSRIRWVGST